MSRVVAFWRVGSGRGAGRIRTAGGGFADLCLTTWLRRRGEPHILSLATPPRKPGLPGRARAASFSHRIAPLCHRFVGDRRPKLHRPWSWCIDSSSGVSGRVRETYLFAIRPEDRAFHTPYTMATSFASSHQEGGLCPPNLLSSIGISRQSPSHVGRTIRE